MVVRMWYRMIAKGIVQGVFFRRYVKEIADSMNLKGYVQNLNDGTVEIVVNLTSSTFPVFIKKVYDAPPPRHVEEIVINKLENEKGITAKLNQNENLNEKFFIKY